MPCPPGSEGSCIEQLGRLVTLDAGACACAEETEPHCLDFGTDGWGGTHAPACFYRVDDEVVFEFGTTYIQAPAGWEDCRSAGAPAACACCAKTLACSPGTPERAHNDASRLMHG